MNKNEVVKMINEDVYLLERALGCIYNKKVFAVISHNMVDKFFKTKRGAEGYNKRNADFSYFDDYSQDMVTPHKNDTIIEISASELKDITTDKKLWHDYLRSNLYNIFGYHMGKNIICTAKDAGVTGELLTYIEETVKEIEDTQSMVLIEEYLENKGVEDELVIVSEPELVKLEESKIEKSTLTEDTKEIPSQSKKTISEYFTIEKSIHTKKNIDIWVCKIINKISKENYIELNNEIKALGGYYSKFVHGFIFEEEPTELLNNSNINKSVFEVVGVTDVINSASELKREYPEININDIETYTIDKKLSERENSISMFRSKDRDHQQEIQNTLQGFNETILEVLEGNTSNYIEHKAKEGLQRFKRKYYDIYVRMLNHKANNPSWAVTGRGGLNVSRYNKKASQYDKMLGESVQIYNDFEKHIDKIKDMVRKDNQEKVKTEIEQNLQNISSVLEFKRVKIKINGDCSAYNNIFNIENARIIEDVTAHQLENYHIIKNWGKFRIYKDGKEIDTKTIKTNSSLEDAKKYVLYLVNTGVTA